MGGFQGSVKFPGLSLYSASKGALAILTECLAEEFKDRQIKVNCLALGSAQTEMLEQAFPGYKAPLSAAGNGCFYRRFLPPRTSVVQRKGSAGGNFYSMIFYLDITVYLYYFLIKNG